MEGEGEGEGEAVVAGVGEGEDEVVLVGVDLLVESGEGEVVPVSEDVLVALPVCVIVCVIVSLPVPLKVPLKEPVTVPVNVPVTVPEGVEDNDVPIDDDREGVTGAVALPVGVTDCEGVVDGVKLDVGVGVGSVHDVINVVGRTVIIINPSRPGKPATLFHIPDEIGGVPTIPPIAAAQENVELINDVPPVPAPPTG